MRETTQAVASWIVALLLLTTTTPASEEQLGAEGGLAAWPGEHGFLSFVWTDARELTKLPAAEGREARTCRISARGAAEYVADRQLKLAGGGFLVDSTSSAAFCDRCRRTGVLDVEFVLIPDEKQLAEPAIVMGAFRRNGAADLLLYQRADTLWLDVVMPPNADRPIRVELGKLRPGQPTHLLLCYVANMPNDKLVCYLNGKLTFSDDYDGGFSNWSADQIVFGQDLAGERSWRGRIMAVALGHRSYNATGAAERYEVVSRRFVSVPASTTDASVIDTGAGGRVLRGAGTVSAPADANRTVPGDLYVEPSTLHCLGFEWNIEGDDNRNGRVEVRYRRPGEDAWHRALDLLRLQRERIAVSNPEWAWQCGNMYAGSILFLDPGTVYEVRLTLLDPDHVGGDDSQQATVVVEKRLRVATKTLPAIAADGRRLHVYPEGFQGQRAEPAFADFAAAYREARPGDQILLHAGRYTFQAVLDKAGSRDRPIAIRAAGDGEVVLAGGGHTLDVSRTAYHWLEGLTFRDNQWAVYCDEQGRTTGLTVVRCRFIDNEVGVFLRSRLVRDVYVADNVFDASSGTWHRQANRKHPYKAVWTNGQGVDVCYNAVHQHWDGLSINQPRQGVHEFDRKVCAVDFYGNDVGQITDDNESDGGQHNVRFFLNRFVDSHVGLSAQPFYGGPVYFVRNVQYNVTRGLVFKLNVEPAGVYILHNTSLTSETVGTNITSGTNVHVHNNLFLGCGGPALHAGVLDPAVSTWDYNGYADSDDVQFRAPGERPARSFRQMQDKFGYEKHRVEIGFGDLVIVPLPQGEAIARSPQDFGDYRPKAGSRAVDAGLVLPNINDGFTGRAPDLGAIECGQPLPHFGPRTADAPKSRPEVQSNPKEKQHDRSQASLSITEANFSNNAYPSLVQLKKNGATVFELLRGQTPGSAGGSLIPLWSTP